MPSEFDLLRPLDSEPRTPSTVDVRRAITDGRRRRRLRRIAGYGGVAALTALGVVGASVAAGALGDAKPDTSATGGQQAAAAKPKSPYKIPGTPGWKAAAATAPTSCTLEKLPVPDNEPMALVSGGDPTGRYLVGRSYPGGGRYQAVIWHDGKVKKVMLPGDLEESLQDVNSAGTAVGWSYQGKSEKDTGPVPYVYADGKVSKLPGAERGSALAINDAGAIVGDDNNKTPLVWPSATKRPIRLPLPAGASGGEASDIDEDGTVVGNVEPAGAGVSGAGIKESVPYVWFADGTHRKLPMPTLDGTTATTARVLGIRNGWATGSASLSDFTRDPKAGASADPAAKAKGAANAKSLRAVQWNVRTGDVRVYADLQFMANAVNAQGWQVGTDQQGRPVLATDDATVVLPDLVGHDRDGLANIPNTVSDDGRIVGGQADDATGTIQAVVWRCQ
jgi:uncharacterized membrane protein